MGILVPGWDFSLGMGTLKQGGRFLDNPDIHIIHGSDLDRTSVKWVGFGFDFRFDPTHSFKALLLSNAR